MPAANVLFVDDDPDLGALAAAVLSRRGFSVAYCSGVGEARELLRRGSIEAVITDLSLVGAGTGIELCREIGRDYPGLPVIVLTGNRDAAAAAKRAGAARFLTKPVSMVGLVEALASVIEAGKRGERPQP